MRTGEGDETRCHDQEIQKEHHVDSTTQELGSECHSQAVQMKGSGNGKDSDLCPREHVFMGIKPYLSVFISSSA